MKNYSESKRDYIKDHKSKGLIQPERRLNALNAIEKTIQQFSPELLEGNTLFTKHTRESFTQKYLNLKGKPLNSAEKSVIVGLFKFSN